MVWYRGKSQVAEQAKVVGGVKLSKAAAAGLSVILPVLFLFGIIYIVGSQISGLAREWPGFKQTYLLTISKPEHWMAVNFHIAMSNQVAPVQIIS